VLILQPFEKTLHGTDVLDNVELVNIPKYTASNAEEPFHPHFEVYNSEIEAFSRVRT